MLCKFKKVFCLPLTVEMILNIMLLAASLNFLLTAKSFGQQIISKNQDLFSICFPNKMNGWVCGRKGVVFSTDNGGRNWNIQQSNTPYTLTSICFIDKKNGWAVGDAGTIIHTSDGGVTWKKQTSPVSYYLMGVCFINNKKGWAVSERTTILSTEDGGDTWKIQFEGPDFILKSVSFCDENNGWAVGEYGFIYHTDDGGQSWTKQAGEYYESEKTGLLEGGAILFDVVAITPTQALAVGINGYVAATTDSGVFWDKKDLGKINASLFGVANDKSGNCIVVGEGVILKYNINDGSLNFGMTQPPIIYGWLYDVAMKGKPGCVAVGSNGWIYLSGSDTKIWKKVEYDQ